MHMSASNGDHGEVGAAHLDDFILVDWAGEGVEYSENLVKNCYKQRHLSVDK